MRALLSLWMVYSLRSWRPLRHTACATSPALAGEAGGTLRPLAGFWFLNNKKPYDRVKDFGFRPLAGFWFLNFEPPTTEVAGFLGFRPLAGFWFLNPRRARPYGVWIKMPFCGAEVLWEQKAVSVCLKSCCVPRPVSRGADSSPMHRVLRKISRENTAGQSPRRIHIIYCALIESSMNLLPSLAF